MSTALVKSNGTALAHASAPDLSLNDLKDLATLYAQSGFFQDARQMAQALVKIMAGRELGFSPIASMNGVYIVKGRVSLGSNLIAAAIKRSGRYDYRVTTMQDDACEIDFFEGMEKIGTSRFTIQDARRANTQNTNAFPRNMLFARALTNGARWYTPDVFGGPVYTPDELGARIDEDENVIEVSPETGEVYEPAPRTQAPRRASDPPQYKHEREDGQTIHAPTIDPATGRPATILRDEQNEHYAPRTTDEEAEQSAAQRKGIGNHRGWMAAKKLDHENRALSLYLLNWADRGEHGWTSRKELTGDDWTRCNNLLAKLKAAELSDLVREFLAEQQEPDKGDPFADDAPIAGLEPCVNCGAQGDCKCTLEDCDRARAAQGALLAVPAATGPGFGSD